ncbi:MAG: ABC transporter permease [Candidatus Aureabacteria bacterium]|nr:ABC transporter permease [Candidatus Auribacterota bacterium]
MAAFIQHTGSITLFSLRSIACLFRRPLFVTETLRQMARVGERCLLPAIGVVAPFGMVITLQGLHIVSLFGVERMLSSILVVSLLRELSPGLCGIMMAAQAGSTAAAELGTMRVKEEIDALSVMAVNPLRYLILPRVIAFTIMCPLVNAIACASGIASGYLTAVVVKGVNRGAFMANLYSFIHPVDIWGGIVKTAVFGFIIGVVSCYYGYHVRGGAEGVGQAANRAVVRSIIAFLGVNYFLTTALFALWQ